MAQGMLKAFFVPGMVKLKPREPLLLPEATDVDRSIPAEVSVDGSDLHDGSSNIIVTQIDPAEEHTSMTEAQGSEGLDNEGTEQSTDAPGH